MKGKRYILACCLISCCLSCFDLSAEEEKYSKEYLDTVKVNRKRITNDYTTIGVNYGVTLSNMYFNPKQFDQQWVFQPTYVSVMYTRYGKMFGYMPYFGIEAGFSYGHSGFQSKPASETSSTIPVIGIGEDGAADYIDGMKMDVFRFPVRAKFHVDIYSFRIMADLGAYAGWRANVRRHVISSTTTPPNKYEFEFSPTDIKFDYGMEGGAGIALLLDPVELHLSALFGWSWSSLYKPDSRPDKYKDYYYRFANPLDLMITFGVHFQLTKRTGKTTRQLRKEAYDNVYGNTDSKDRQ